MGKRKRISEDDLLLLMDQTVRHLKQQLSRQLRTTATVLTADQWTLLQEIVDQEGISPSQLALVCGKDQPTVTRMLHLMERHGWITKEISPADRRSLWILPTKKGQELYRDVRAKSAETLKESFRVLGDKELRQLRKHCRSLLAADPVAAG
jgi:DNA-binding MarR family transcriptional regulator